MKIQVKVLLITLAIIVADQALKIWVKTTMCLGQEYTLIGDKVRLYFTENNGMAFGMELWGTTGKLLLTVFRVVFIGVIGWYLVKLIKRHEKAGIVYALAVMLAGAAGNLIDCLFYGLMFSASTYTSVAQMFPPMGGYAPLMFGKVVDMFYLPVVNTVLPQWVPIWGGEHFIFFRPIFNIADSAITCSVFYLLIFQRKALSLLLNEKTKTNKQRD
ncbi:lipoprotein signal peptidase [Bacteroidia bacterium]|nr:lipoprotein signal peptidase [Bacteroidia bacterium]